MKSVCMWLYNNYVLQVYVIIYMLLYTHRDIPRPQPPPSTCRVLYQYGYQPGEFTMNVIIVCCIQRKKQPCMQHF